GRALERRGGGRDVAAFVEHHNRSGDVQERVLADERVIALEQVLVVRVEDAAEVVRVVKDTGVTLAVTIPFWEADAPAILDGVVFVIGAGARINAAGPGVTERRREHRFGEP